MQVLNDNMMVFDLDIALSLFFGFCSSWRTRTADLDSVVCAISLAYALNTQDGNKRVAPVINIPRRDWALRTVLWMRNNAVHLVSLLLSSFICAQMLRLS